MALLTGDTTCVLRECAGKFATDCRPQLRVKIRSLAAESRIIRHEQRKYRGQSAAFASLYFHRTWVVRRETRSALLAYTYLRGRSYRSVEAKVMSAGPPDAARISAIVKKYGKSDAIHGLQEWLSE